MNEQDIIESTKNWVDSFVIELNLCPFAKAEVINQKVRFSVTDSDTEEQLLEVLQAELNLLLGDSNTETSLLIHPKILLDFDSYNDFLDLCDALLLDMALEGVFQIASFHPAYQFADTQVDDAENFTNKSPYPMLHILREDSLAQAIKKHSDINSIPNKNIQTLKKLGQEHCLKRLKNCLISSS